MKKSLILTIAMIFLTFAANAFALVSYDQTFAYSKDFTLNNGNGNSGTSFSFANITNNFIVSATTPYPSLSLILSGNHFSDVLQVNGDNKVLTTLSTTNPTYVFNPTTLGYLNNAITNGSVTFSLVRASGTSHLASARLTGTVAPEPDSMALVCAGLLALPFARRLRKAH